MNSLLRRADSDSNPGPRLDVSPSIGIVWAARALFRSLRHGSPHIQLQDKVDDGEFEDWEFVKSEFAAAVGTASVRGNVARGFVFSWQSTSRWKSDMPSVRRRIKDA